MTGRMIWAFDCRPLSLNRGSCTVKIPGLMIERELIYYGESTFESVLRWKLILIPEIACIISNYWVIWSRWMRMSRWRTRNWWTCLYRVVDKWWSICLLHLRGLNQLRFISDVYNESRVINSGMMYFLVQKAGCVCGFISTHSDILCVQFSFVCVDRICDWIGCDWLTDSVFDSAEHSSSFPDDVHLHVFHSFIISTILT